MRLCGQSISSQIRGDNSEPLRKSRGNFAPHNVRLWRTVKEEKRRAISTNDSVNRGAKAVNRMGFESGKEGRCLAPNRSQFALQKIITARAYNRPRARDSDWVSALRPWCLGDRASSSFLGHHLHESSSTRSFGQALKALNRTVKFDRILARLCKV